MKRAFEVFFWAVVGLIGVPVFAIVIYTFIPKQTDNAKDIRASDDQITSAPASNLSPSGEIADVFSMFSSATELQRDELERRITGKIVQWRLPVYNVSERNGFYVIQTKSRAGLVSAFCYVSAADDNVRRRLLSLKEDDYVTCKGLIAGSSLRTIQIKPAILL